MSGELIPEEVRSFVRICLIRGNLKGQCLKRFAVNVIYNDSINGKKNKRTGYSCALVAIIKPLRSREAN